MIASSGIDYDVKIWEPSAREPADLLDADEVKMSASCNYTCSFTSAHTYINTHAYDEHDSGLNGCRRGEDGRNGQLPTLFHELAHLYEHARLHEHEHSGLNGCGRGKDEENAHSNSLFPEHTHTYTNTNTKTIRSKIFHRCVEIRGSASYLVAFPIWLLLGV